MLRPLIVIFILLLGSTPLVYAWPNLDNEEGILEYVNSLVDRHPKLPTANIQYRLNPFKAFVPVPGLISELGAEAANIDETEVQLHGLKYQSIPVKFDQTKISDLKTELKQKLEQLPLQEFRGIKSDIEALVKIEKQAGGKSTKSTIRDLIILAPFIYDGQGRLAEDGIKLTKKSLAAKIESLSVQDLMNGFGDYFEQHLKEALDHQISDESRRRFIEGVFNSVKSDFIAKKVQNAIRPVADSGGALQARTVSLEPIGAVSVLRGFSAGDCSGLSVPYYPLVKGAKAFWIRKDMNPNSDPVGYVFVVEVTVEGKKVPYILTINSSTMGAADTRSIIKLLGHIYQTDQVVLPNFSIGSNRWLVNYSTNRIGMQVAKSRAVKVQLPQGWKVIEDYTKSRPVTGGYGNFYAAVNVENAFLAQINDVDVNPVNLTTSRPFTPYKRVADLKSHPLLERAVLANNALLQDKATNLKFNRTKILHALDVSEEQLQAASPLIRADKNRPITKAQLDVLQRTFDFKFAQLQRLDVITRAYTMNQLYKEDTSIATPDEWQKSVQLGLRYLRNALGDLEQALQVQNGQLIPEYFLAKNQLTFLGVAEDYWDYEIEVLKLRRPNLTLSTIESIPVGSSPPVGVVEELVRLAESSSDYVASAAQKISQLQLQNPLYKDLFFRLLKVPRIGVTTAAKIYGMAIAVSTSIEERADLRDGAQGVFRNTLFGHNGGIEVNKGDAKGNKNFFAQVVETQTTSADQEAVIQHYLVNGFSFQFKSFDNDRNEQLSWIVENYFDRLSARNKKQVALSVLENEAHCGINWGSWAYQVVMDHQPGADEMTRALGGARKVFAQTGYGHNNGISASQSGAEKNKSFFTTVYQSLPSQESRQALVIEYLEFATKLQFKSPDNDRGAMLTWLIENYLPQLNSQQKKKFALYVLEQDSRIGSTWCLWAFKLLMAENPSESEKVRAQTAARRVMAETEFGHNNGIYRSSGNREGNKNLFSETLNSYGILLEKQKLVLYFLANGFIFQFSSPDNDRFDMLTWILNNYLQILSEVQRKELALSVLENSKGRIGVYWAKWAFQLLTSNHPTAAESARSMIAVRRCFAETEYGHNDGLSRSSSDDLNNKELFIAVSNSIHEASARDQFREELLANALQFQAKSADTNRGHFIETLRNHTIILRCEDLL